MYLFSVPEGQQAVVESGAQVLGGVPSWPVTVRVPRGCSLQLPYSCLPLRQEGAEQWVILLGHWLSLPLLQASGRQEEKGFS